MKEKKIIKGYKSFDKDFECRGFQYEVGKTYEEKEAKLCSAGFHFCENPLDILNYYDLTDGNFAEVEAEDVSDERENSDSKRVAKKLTIKAKLDLPMFVKASVDFLLELCNKKDKNTEVNDGNSAQLASSGNSAKLASSGYYAKLASSGYFAKLASSGDSAQLASSGNSAKLASSGNSAKLASSGYFAQLASSGDSAQLASSGDSAKLASSGNSAKLASSGDSAQLASSGDFSVVAGIGIDNIAKGAIGNWLVLTEWEFDGKNYIPVCVKSEKIDGEKLKADTYYKLEKGEFVVCE